MTHYPKRVAIFLKKILKEIVSTNGNIGLNVGELSAEVMAETGVNPDTRNIIRVTVEDVEEMKKQFEIWLGNDVSERKGIIENELNKYFVE